MRMTKNQELDYVITLLKEYNRGNQLVKALEIPISKDFDIPEIEDALDKLVELGFAGRDYAGHGYWLNFTGRQFIENAPNRFFKNQPFVYENFKSKLSIAWKVTKTVGLILNSLAILLLMLLPIKVDNKSSIIERESKQYENLITKQISIIDSLNKELMIIRSNGIKIQKK